jgi:bifunctional DNA-binding transcriptional regulator/antitoxin component of YhaV-PrlF toxin-antitoxin module
MDDITTLTPGFSISIPESLCAAQGWKPGQKLALVPTGAGVMLVPAPSIEDLEGLARGADARGYRDRADRF